MGTLFRFIQIVFSSSCNNILLMLQIMLQHLKNIHDLRLIIYQSKHDHTERILKLCMFI